MRTLHLPGIGRTTAILLASTVLAATVVTGSPAAGSPSPVTVPSTPVTALSGSAACAPMTPTALAEFFAGALPQRMERYRVPGIAVSVVSGGDTVFAQGYGFADAENRVPFDADRTLTRIASISKTFTNTAVMQQVEAGRLDLSVDINRYLTDLRIPPAFGRPITLRDLMDHTAGFEDIIIGTGARAAGDVPPLGRFLADHMPARIRPPGEVSAYSNYGTALAGHIVAQVSGEPFDQYVRRHILDPLGMAHSTAAEPVPAMLAPDLARSYNSDHNPPRRVPFQFNNLGPDGSVSTTAADLARFMSAHLTGGRAILSPATAARMHQRSFAADGRLDGYAHGFKERTINGRRALTHDGSWEGFLSAMFMLPGCDLGLFVTSNATGGAELLKPVLDDFFGRFAPADGTPDPSARSTSHGPTRPAAPRAGFYTATRHNESTVERVLVLLGQLRLTIHSGGTIGFKGRTWMPLGDGLYREKDGTERLAFRVGPDGQSYAVTDTSTYQLLDPADRLLVNLTLLGAVLLVSLTALAVPVAGAWRRWRRRRGTAVIAAPNRTWRLARTLATVAALGGPAYLVAILLTLLGDTRDYIYGAPLRFQLLLGVPLVILLVAVGAAVATVLGWRGKGTGVVARIHQVCLLGGLVAMAWFLGHWHLIGWWAA